MKSSKPKVLITGSTSGIGYFLAKGFSNNNYKVILNGRSKKKLNLALKNVNNADYIFGDMSKINIIKNNIKKLYKKYNSIDVIIANIGNSNFKKNNKNFDFAIKNNLMPAINLIENSKQILKKNSKIICISSICGAEVIDGAPIGYSVAKAALNFYVKSASRELAKSGVSLNAIMPGNIIFKNSIWEKKLKKNKLKTLKYISENVPSNKFGTPSDIFLICEMLCNNKSGFINGSIFKVDGGQTLSL